MDTLLAYGEHGLPLTLPDPVTVIEPQYIPALPDPLAALRQALRAPVGSAPLRDRVRATDTVAIVFSDITRPAPSHLMIPAILAELDHVPATNVVLINGLGTHRPNTDAELRRMLGADVVDRYRIEQHSAFDRAGLVYLGDTQRGHPVWINRVYMDADVKIITGFIEPHFFAGFSGGPKGIMPGVAGLDTIMANHGVAMLNDPGATWGVTWGNPLWEECREITLKTDPAFLLNVTLNRDKQITGVFAGSLDGAHAAGTAFARETAMVPVDAPFDIVITTNSGYPLDQNLYQSVKGMSAAAQIVREGGAILIASECRDGVPDHGLYGAMLRESASVEALMDRLIHAPEPRQDQWQIQIQALIQRRAAVHVYSDTLSTEQIESAFFTPCRDIAATVAALRGPDTRIAVLPDGPQTIPYVRERVAGL